MKRRLGQIEVGEWIAKDGSTVVAVLASKSTGPKSVEEYYATIDGAPKFPFNPVDMGKVTWAVASTAPNGWSAADLKAWAKSEIGKDPNAEYNATANW